jgi:23S rRNA U2552 (ribose-2'-O)-methylase RlmE/FtsJ
MLDYYDTKLLTINNKLYSAVNLISYQFITYDDIKLNFDLTSKTLTKYTGLNNLSKNLNRIKRAIDTRYFKKWQYITFQLDNYKLLGEYISKKYNVFSNKTIKPSNAFMKIYEMLMSFNIIDKSKPTLKSFHFCEAPGMFIMGLNHYLQTKTNIKSWDWYGNSLTIDADKTALSDAYGLIGANKNKWLIGPASSGDIRELANIDFFKEKLSEVDLITSDCGICVDTCELNNYEELIAETDFAQFVNMLNLLAKGGSGIIKTFIPLELASNVCLIYTLTQVFEEVYFSKPITSRPANSEVYLVCIGYLGIDQVVLNQLKQLLNKKINPKFNPKLNWIKNIPQSFIKQLEDYVVEITRQQISYLLNIFHFIDNTAELEKIKLIKDDKKLKEVTNQYWCKKFSFESNNGVHLI